MALPLVFEKYREESIFGPSDFLAYMQRSGLLKEAEKAPKAVILSYQRSLFDYVIKNHPVHFHDGYFKNHLAFLDETGGQIAIAGRFGIGAPAAAMMLEELIAFGAHSFISLGTAGGLIPGLHPGDLVLCTGALRDEGVSYHYVPGGGPALPDESMTSSLEANMLKAGVQSRKGLAWTIDALYRETRIEMDQHIARGAVVVEMEASALFTVARYREARLASCFTISDSLAEPEWKPEFLAEETGSGLETLYHIALETLTQTL